MARSFKISLLFADYGIVIALLAVAVYYSLATLDEQHVSGEAGGARMAEDLATRFGPGAGVLIVVSETRDDEIFARALAGNLQQAGLSVMATVRGQPADARRALEQIANKRQRLDAIAANPVAAAWPPLHDLERKYPALRDVPVVLPRSYRWPSFLKVENLLNIANQVAIIAIMAIGMTLVILTGGIDLSVGSLMALSAVLATLLIRDAAGAEQASASALVLCCLAAILVCAGVGMLTGTLITAFEIPPFIATLAMMLVASGLANMAARSQSIYELPASLIWLGRGADLWRIPNAVVLMGMLYGLAHLAMTRTTFGRYVYAVGGNRQAAWLSGIRVGWVLVWVYTLSATLAGLGGVIMASQLKSGSPTYGLMYELYVIAAVVVGGTSVNGGEGKIFGTLLGAFLIAVVQNGMNLTGVESHPQKVVLGLVILGSVLLDKGKRTGWGSRWLRGLSKDRGHE